MSVAEPPAVTRAPETAAHQDGAAESRRTRESRNYLRGSSLLFSGRWISLLLNLAVQTLIVRSLSKTEYGAFAYGLGAASIGTSVLLLGLDKATSRFVPIFQERGEEPKALGTIVMSMGIVFALGLTLVLAVFGLRGWLLGNVVQDPRAFALLLTLIVLAPIDAFDALLQNVTAIFVGARAIFVRRHVLGPGLRLAAVLVVLAVSGDVVLLGYGYVLGAVLGIAVYVAILVSAFRQQGILSRFRLRTLEFPAREVLGYSMPLLSSEVVVLITGALAVVLVEYFRDPSAVAEFRSVLPIARLNGVVMQSFALLYIPFAARMYARKDLEGINQLYWRTATWIAVLSFPVFLLTSVFARPLAALIFGAAYASSGPLLAVLAFGSYFNAALGFNSYTFRVCGPVRYVVAIDLTSATIGLGTTVLLTRQFGAMGAALGSTFTLVLLNLLTHFGLVRARTGVRLLDWSFLRTYVRIAVFAGALALVQHALALPIYAGVVLVAAASAILLYLSRRTLEVGDTFPELLRLPLLRQLLARDADPRAKVLSAHLRDHAGRYVRGAAADVAEATLVRVIRRRVSQLYRFDVYAGGRREALLIKVPVLSTEASRPVARPDPVADRPRLAVVSDPATRAELEHAALRQIEAHFTGLADPRMGAVRVFDYLPDHGALVMQFVGEPNLRRLVMRAWSRGNEQTTRALCPAFANVGAWLRHYHALPTAPTTRQRHTQRADIVEHVTRVASFLGSQRDEQAYFAAIAARIDSVAQADLPSAPPLGRSHGDFAMRNVLVAPDSRVTAVDTLGLYSTVVYEDIGYFLADLRCNPVHALARTSSRVGARVLAFERAFLAGYFDGSVVPTQAVALYEVAAILDRWSSLTLRRAQASGASERFLRTAHSLAMSRALRAILHERLGVATGGVGVLAAPLRMHRPEAPAWTAP